MGGWLAALQPCGGGTVTLSLNEGCALSLKLDLWLSFEVALPLWNGQKRNISKHLHMRGKENRR